MKALLTQRNLKISVILITLSFISFWLIKTEKVTAAKVVESTNYDAADIGENERYVGPFISRPDVMEILDKLSDNGDCAKSGQLAFPCLIQDIQDKADRIPPTKKYSNPFNLGVMQEITKTIFRDLDSFRPKDPKNDPIPKLYSNFLKEDNSRLQLVGIVNRMDRKTNTFIKSKKYENDPYRCGEISLVYRFLYSIDNTGSSRVPVTMNVVFPALTAELANKSGSCKVIASRWLEEMNLSANRDAGDIVKNLTKENGILSTLKGSDIDRIELNMQAFRVSTGSDTTGLGSPATYVIRVFRWNKKIFAESFLHNQIDRARLLGDANGDANTCKENKGKPLSKEKFLAYLSNPKVLSAIDSGSVIIPREFLACRAISGSPGGAYRSINNQFWNAKSSDEQLLTDTEINSALEKARKQSSTSIPIKNRIKELQYIGNAEDFRLRLSEQSCSGCHQARAIAGFHFPGADRKETISSNAVYLPGSPHFYGDQPRRMEILQEYANGTQSDSYKRAPSYASRPDERFRKEFEKFEKDGEKSQFIGGWGGTCLIKKYMDESGTSRNWTCNDGLSCVQLFKSANAPGTGTCVSKDNLQIGDALQIGEIISNKFGDDRYIRTSNTISDDKNDKNRLIDLTNLSPLLAKLTATPEGNSYLGAHQEFYNGSKQPNNDKSYFDKDKQDKYYFDCGLLTSGSKEQLECLEQKRDYSTGGFSGGMLRLTECRNLPKEATCALVAFSGFNDCISDVSSRKPIERCFQENTAYAGLRACDLNSPCRDDYICLRPLVKTSDDSEYISEILMGFQQRKSFVDYLEKDFGQQSPDDKWLNKKDRRGVCIPPYFVFQFRSDGHPSARR